ncbi:MAG: tetratricopeptide repeat protein, partial [Thermoanaerobaculia bacterium]
MSLGVWNLDRGGDAIQPASASLPDPDTSSMTVPVARAIREARAAALAQPDSADAVGRLGQVYHAHGLYDAAAACYEIARKRAPDDFRWVYLLAGVEELRSAEGERVDELFRAAIRLLPRYPPVYVRHGDALLRLGRWAEARDAYAAAIERDPELALAQRGLGQTAL